MLKFAIVYSVTEYADVVELVDTLALGASAFGREGSSPFIRTKIKRPYIGLFIFIKNKKRPFRRFYGNK